MNGDNAGMEAHEAENTFGSRHLQTTRWDSMLIHALATFMSMMEGTREYYLGSFNSALRPSLKYVRNVGTKLHVLFWN